MKSCSHDTDGTSSTKCSRACFGSCAATVLSAATPWQTCPTKAMAGLVIEARSVEAVDRVQESRDSMRAITLNDGESEVFARAALAPLRRPDKPRANHGIANPDAAPL